MLKIDFEARYLPFNLTLLQDEFVPLTLNITRKLVEQIILNRLLVNVVVTLLSVLVTRIQGEYANPKLFIYFWNQMKRSF